MFIFHWLHVFDDAYRNGFADGFSVGFACFLGIALFRWLIRRENRKFISRLKKHVSSGLLFDDSEKLCYCPICAAENRVSKMIKTEGVFVCPKCNHSFEDPMNIRLSGYIGPR